MRYSIVICTTLSAAITILAAPRCAAQQPDSPIEKVVSVTLAPATVFINQTERFEATITYEGDEDLGLKPTWSLDGDCGVLTTEGVFTAGPRRSHGTVTATLGEHQASAEVTVVPYAHFACHVDGRIVYSTQDGGDSEYDVFVMNADGSAPVNLTANPADPPEGFDLAPTCAMHACWSPDGSTIIYEGMDETSQVICTVNADGSGAEVILRGAGMSYYRPTFSPDGATVLLDGWATDPPGSPHRLFTMNADGSGLRRLTHDPEPEEDAVWSPDGEWIAFVKERTVGEGTVCEIWLMDKAGENARRLTPEGGTAYFHPAWSPDGARIACTITGEGYLDIALISVADGSVEVLTRTSDVADSGPAWTWDGTKILYATEDPPGLTREIWAMEAGEGHAVENVTNRPDLGNFLRKSTYAY